MCGGFEDEEFTEPVRVTRSQDSRPLSDGILLKSEVSIAGSKGPGGVALGEVLICDSTSSILEAALVVTLKFGVRSKGSFSNAKASREAIGAPPRNLNTGISISRSFENQDRNSTATRESMPRSPAPELRT